MTLDRRSRRLRHSAVALALVTALLTVLPAVAGHAGAREQRVSMAFAAVAGARAPTGSVTAGGSVLTVTELSSGSGPRRRTGTTTSRSLAVMNVTPGEPAALRDDPGAGSVEDDVPVRADATLRSQDCYPVATGRRPRCSPVAEH